ncbi:MAG: hypothetical protein JWL75_572, partial [Parcubacteria group bacterium]|nr:hypothetical protein [Parcubacteria group bacterium]
MPAFILKQTNFTDDGAPPGKPKRLKPPA